MTNHAAIRPRSSSDLGMRLMGGTLLLAGVVLIKFFVWDVLEGARAGKTDLLTIPKVVMAIPSVMTLGLLGLTFGNRVLPRIKIDKSKLKIEQIVFLLIGLALGVSLQAWLSFELSELGYRD